MKTTFSHVRTALRQDENPVTTDTEKVTTSDLQITKISQKHKPQKQTSLAAYFPVVNQEKGEPIKESVNSTPVVAEAAAPPPAPGARKLPPIELPATRGATKRASLQKETAQDVQVKKPEVAKKVANSSETRKSTDSKKSTESRKSTGRSESEDVSDDDGSPNDEDDPNRLWCICKRPHNNRFMICCDVCEDWFHGKCVGITKAMGEKMEEQEIEWMCPNCKKKKKQEEAGKQNCAKKLSTPVTPVESVVETPPSTSKEKKNESSKVIVQQQKLVVLSQETPKNTKGPEVRISKVARKSADDRKSLEVKEADSSKELAHNNTTSSVQEANVTGPGAVLECIVCHKQALPGGVYCSDECIARHTSESLSVIDKSSVIVFEKKTGRIYSGPNMPTPSTLTSWLMAHPSYEVMRPGVLPTAKFYNQKPPGPRPPLRQTTLQTRPQGIQLIAALPQPPPVEGPPKKTQKAETPKNKLQPRGQQQQITSLLKAQQAKQEAKAQQIKQDSKVQQSKQEVKVQQSKQEVKVQQAKQEVKTQQTKQDVKKVQQAKQDVPEVKTAPPKALTSPTLGKKPVKEVKKAPQAAVKKVTPVQPKKVVREEKEEGRGKEAEEQAVRASVKKTLQEVLSTRLLDVTDIKLNEDQIRKIITQIEEELYLLFKDTGAKYKSKYRSLMFNIKDAKNLTLFRKIADKSISPEQLVRLSPEELASQELAQWREQEARHQLEMIKKTELDMMQQAKTVVMKTHKGEQVVENDDELGAKVLETSVEIEPVMTETPIVSVPVTKTKPKEDTMKLKGSKHLKKDKKEHKHKERKHGHKSHHKSHDRSRSRHRHRSDSDRGSRSKSRQRADSQPKSRSVSPEAPITGEKLQREGRSRSIHRHDDKEISRSKPLSGRERSKSRGRSTLRDRSKSKERGRSKSSPRERSKSRHREPSKSIPRERSKSRQRERSKSRPRERSKSRQRERSKSKDRSRSKSSARDRSRSRPRKMSPDFEEASTPIEIAIPSSSSLEELGDVPIPSIKPTQFYEEVKEIINDVVVQEESGADFEEDLSDHEPSSTVNINTPPLDNFEDESEAIKPPVWRGTLEMPDVAKFSTSIQEVSGICGDLAVDLPDTLDCVGRIGPEIAWDYIAKMKKSGTKQILVVRFTADNEEDEMSYLSFYSYLSTRNRLGVVGNNSKMIKDFYVLPLPSHSPVPQVLLPLDGPGFEDYRPHLLLGIIVRTRRKRTLTEKDIPFVPKIPKKSERSYTPPLPEEESHTPTQQQPDTESFTPPHSPKPPRIIKLKSSSKKASNSPTVSDDFMLEDDGDTPYTPEDEDAPYSPGDGADKDGGRTPSPCSEELQRKVNKLQSMINKIEQEKQKIDSMATIPDISSSEGIVMSRPEDEDDLEEAYSPSGSITPPPPDTSYLDKNKISLPSDLQDIIASLKKKTDEPKSMDLKSDPIVQAYRSNDEAFSPEDEKADEPVEEDLIKTPPIEETLPIPSVAKTSSTSLKVNRDPRQRAQFSLSQISDEELLKKASEMGFMNPENPDPIPDNLKGRTSLEPPPPGLEEEYDPFNTDSTEFQTPLVHQPPQPSMPMFTNQPFPPAPQTFNPEYPPPPIPPNFHPPGQFLPTPMFQAPPPLPPLPPPSHIPFTNPQPPPPQPPPMYPPPPPQPAPLPPPLPRESPERTRPSLTRKKLSKKPKKEHKSKDRSKNKKERRRYSESPPPKDYDSDKFEKNRDRDKYSSRKRSEKRDSWRTYDKEPVPEKRRDSWEYEAPVMSGPPIPHPAPPTAGPPPVFGMPGPMRGMPMRGRFQRGMRGMFRGRGFERPPMRGFHRGGFHPRGHHPVGGQLPLAGPSRTFNIQKEYEEDIRRFEEQRKQKNLDRKRWRKDSPPPTRKRRSKDDDSD